MRLTHLLRLTSILFVGVTGIAAEEIKIAVAANFVNTLGLLVPVFEKQYPHRCVVVPGSTGKFYLQIKNGAPFDVFLAADTKHPRLLENEGFAVKGTRFSYAIGKLALWSPRDNFVDAQGKILEAPGLRSVAMANPDLAPYGFAAREYLTRMGLWEKLSGRIALGQDIGQTYHFINSGASEVGFIALSQVSGPGSPMKGSTYVIPQDKYTPLVQEAIVIREGTGARDFLRFLQTADAKKTIRFFGYGFP